MTTLQLPLPFLLQSGNEMDLFKLVDMKYGPKYQRAVTYHEGRHSRRRTPFTENPGNSVSVSSRAQFHLRYTRYAQRHASCPRDDLNGSLLMWPSSERMNIRLLVLSLIGNSGPGLVYHHKFKRRTQVVPYSSLLQYQRGFL